MTKHKPTQSDIDKFIEVIDPPEPDVDEQQHHITNDITGIDINNISGKKIA